MADGEGVGERRPGRQVLTEREVLRRRGYELGQGRLGEGRYSKVRGAKRLVDQRDVAVKVLDLGRLAENYWERWGRREVETMEGLAHPSVLGLLEWWSVGRKVFLVLELGKGGDLLRLVQRDGALGEAAVRSSASQLLQGLSHLHRRRIAHRDLKLENILVMEAVEAPAAPLLKLADFTFARAVPPDMALCRTFCGSRAYSCPEILAASPYCPFRGDVWALGVVVFILALGRMPFNERAAGGRAGLVEQQRGRAWRERLAEAPVSEPLKDLVLSALVLAQAHRPTSAQLLAHPALQAPANHPPQPLPLPDQLPHPQPSQTLSEAHFN